MFSFGRSALIMPAAVLTAIALSVQGAGVEGSGRPGDNVPQRVAALEARVATLEKELAALKGARGVSAVRSPLEVPANWREGRINGMTYYIVPLREEPQPSALSMLEEARKNKE